MTVMTWLAVALGAAVGAPARYALERWMTAATVHSAQAASAWLRQPWGLVLVNCLGSAIVGVVLATTTGDLRLLLTVGLCGSLTTFSGYGWSAHAAWSSDRRAFWAGIIVMTGTCIAAFALAHAVARALSV